MAGSLTRAQARGVVTRLAEILQDSVDLLGEAELEVDDGESETEPEASLVQQCVELATAGAEMDDEPIRTVHHFACTGGTLLSKCLAAMPNVQLLSEVDPLSPMGRAPGSFAPTDMSALLKGGTRPVSHETLLALFRAQLDVAYQAALSQGSYLVLRDHSHSHFCTGDRVPERQSLRELAEMVAPVLSLVTVRNPIDSYASLQSNRWVGFQPATFDEYCARYLAFLDRYTGHPVMRFEDFVLDPGDQMQDACRHLRLPYFDGFPSVFAVFQLSGGSGRQFSSISLPPPRPDREPLVREAAASANYRALAKRLGYLPEQS